MRAHTIGYGPHPVGAGIIGYGPYPVSTVLFPPLAPTPPPRGSHYCRSLLTGILPHPFEYISGSRRTC
jgi:hypothetical protein